MSAAPSALAAPSPLAERMRAQFDLTGTVAVVTGAGRGLGRAMAEGLAGFGAEVVLCGRTGATLEAAAEAMAAEGARVWWKTADVSREEDVTALLDAVLERHGRVDTLVNNAGINPIYKAAERTDRDDWQAIIDINLSGVYLCCRHFGAAMLERRRGSIINITSVAGHVGLRKTMPYGAAKGGVEMMSKSLAIDWAPAGVRVNCIAPGYFESDLTAAMIENAALSRRLLGQTPMGRFGRGEDLVGAVVYLASPAASYVTGQSIVIDGGWTAQ